MRFAPKNDNELNNFDLFPAGEYDFSVIKAEDETSKAGNEMIKIEIDIYSSAGTKTRVFDYLLEAIAYKLKHFCQAVGLEKEYEEGTLTANMCCNRSGRCLVLIQKDKSGEYPDKNVIKDYCKSKKISVASKMNLDIDDSEIPF